MDSLVVKTLTWEKEQGMKFLYDNVSEKYFPYISFSSWFIVYTKIIQTELLSMLKEYTILREEKEQERRRQRVKKNLNILPLRSHLDCLLHILKRSLCKTLACRNKRNRRLMIKVWMVPNQISQDRWPSSQVTNGHQDNIHIGFTLSLHENDFRIINI